MARKLILTRDDGADRVIEALGATKETAITVVAPRGSALASREGLAEIGEVAAERGIAVAIESVDEELLSLAHAAHLETVHPFFRSDRRHLSMDGVAKREAPVQPREPVHVEKSHPTIAHEAPRVDSVVHRPKVVVDAPVVEEDAQEEEAVLPPHDHMRGAAGHPLPTPIVEREAQEERPAPAARPSVKRRFSPLKVGIAGVVALAVLVGLGEGFFRSATVSVTLAETSWDYTGTIVAATSVTTSTGTTLAVPGQLFESQKNVAQAFPATGEKGASATAPSASDVKVTVTNESLEAETFVVRTRFQGKSGIFRAASAVAIPAAKKDGDKLVPGTATVAVTPESDAVLSGATDGEKLTVPGLAGSPKASLFYGTLVKPSAAPAATSTASGTTPPAERTVTSDDETKAKSQINDILSSSFKASLIASQPAGLSVIDGAIQITTPQMTVNKEVDASGNFNLVGQATLRALAFREDDLKNLLLNQAVNQKGITYPATFRKIDISYSDVKPDLANGRMTFTVTAHATVIGKLSEDEVRLQSVGKSRSAAAAWIAGESMLSEGSVSASPFWRFAIPSDPAKVSVEIK